MVSTTGDQRSVESGSRQLQQLVGQPTLAKVVMLVATPAFGAKRPTRLSAATPCWTALAAHDVSLDYAAMLRLYRTSWIENPERSSILVLPSARNPRAS